MDKEVLIKAGLVKNEAKVYLALLKLGFASIWCYRKINGKGIS